MESILSEYHNLIMLMEGALDRKDYLKINEYTERIDGLISKIKAIGEFVIEIEKKDFYKLELGLVRPLKSLLVISKVAFFGLYHIDDLIFFLRGL